ncbi:hypothetical protein [Longimicrobium terrae]|uniref:Uncharacterized protein n=1 Tax=Longimicrobium terrae TaxID=1639882 RepID=A0A841GJD8_9BACT|nr:hypothetical protein [Longimicrobium terrae]MBB4634309.1 hypothetical protein [Longimicrobium terrae]MBB6068801.1 hypothetical protein [Longimicrobium terrae]NNC27986.1 hypothetical protein [Longimicrobium terrae]
MIGMNAVAIDHRDAARRPWCVVGLALILTLVSVQATAAQSVCPSGNDHEIARGAVAFFFEERPDVALQAGVPQMDTSGLRVLVDATDAAACQRFRAEVYSPELRQPPWRHMMYELGGYYFEVFYMVADPDDILLYQTPFRVRDSQMRVLFGSTI